MVKVITFGARKKAYGRGNSRGNDRGIFTISIYPNFWKGKVKGESSTYMIPAWLDIYGYAQRLEHEKISSSHNIFHIIQHDETQ